MLSFASRPLLRVLRESRVEAVAVDVAVDPRPRRTTRSSPRRLLRRALRRLRRPQLLSTRSGIIGLSGMAQLNGTTMRSGTPQLSGTRSGTAQLSGTMRSGLNGRQGPGSPRNVAVSQRLQLEPPDPSLWAGPALAIMLPFMLWMRPTPSAIHTPLPVATSPPSREAIPRRCGWALQRASFRRLTTPWRKAPEAKPRQESRTKACAVLTRLRCHVVFMSGLACAGELLEVCQTSLG